MEKRTMMHHGANYTEAKSDAAKKMREKLATEIEAARRSGAATIKKVLETVPKDRLVPIKKTTFALDDSGRQIVVQYDNATPEHIHPFAFGQMSETVGVPRDYIRRLLNQPNDGADAWGPELAIDNLNRMFRHASNKEDRRLVRSVGGETRGYLSDRYSRVHPGYLVDAFTQTCRDLGLIPYGGHAGDTKFFIKAVLDRVIEPVKDEVLSIGVVFKESSFGDGATELSIFFQRMFCTNTAIAVSELKRVHLTSRMLDLGAAEHEKALEMSSKAMAAELQAAMRKQLMPNSIEKLEQTVRAATEVAYSHTAFEEYLKKRLSAQDVEVIKDKFRSADVEQLPAGNTWWRASNAISWFANQQAEPEKQFELQRLAGDIIQRKVLR